MEAWHVWTILPQRYKKVEDFLQTAPGVINYLYPTVEQEYETKAGKKTKGIPLYNNYIFIKYKGNNNLHTRLSNCPWIKDYIGLCSKEEMAQVKKMASQKYEDIMPTSEIKEGRDYKLKGTVFKDMMCTVVSIDGDRLVVSIELFGSDRLIKCSKDDINLEG
jgi:transcription antitermination factor NusG